MRRIFLRLGWALQARRRPGTSRAKERVSPMFWPICALCRASMLCRQARRMPGGYCRAWLLRYTRSVDLEAGLFDHVGPAFLFRDQPFAQVFPRRSDNNEAKIVRESCRERVCQYV